MLVVNCVLNPIAVPGRVDAGPLIEKPEKVRHALKEAIDQLPENTITLLPKVRGEFPEQVISEMVQKLEIISVCFPVNSRKNPDGSDWTTL